MSNDDTALEKADPDAHWLERIGKNPKIRGIESIAKIGGVLMTPSVLTAVIGYLAGLPIYLYIPLGSIVLLVISIIWFVFSYRPENKRLNNELTLLRSQQAAPVLLDKPKESEELEISLRREIRTQEELLRRCQGDNKDDKAQYQRDIEGLKTQYDAKLKTNIDDAQFKLNEQHSIAKALNKELESHARLLDKVRAQKGHIADDLYL